MGFVTQGFARLACRQPDWTCHAITFAAFDGNLPGAAKLAAC
jgi:hypothetical protein